MLSSRATDSDRQHIPVESKPTSFAELAGFAEDDHAEAYRVFRRSCAAIVANGPCLRPAMPPSAALLFLCREVLDLGALESSDARRFFETRFRPHRILAPAAGETEGSFLTGYYEPIVDGSLVRTEAFSAPILGNPKERHARGAAFDERAPLPTRATLEALAGDGRFEPIVWLRDPVEVYFAQVQGSARVRLADGTMVRLVYAGRNGHPYTSIGRILVDSGEIPREEMSLARLKAWIRDHGLAQGSAGAALMQRNDSYPDPAEGPLGGQGIALTPLRSIAIDRRLYFYGLPFFVSARLPWKGPEATWFRRLMIAQDTGSAIVGPARADIFFGTGDDAGARAGDIRHAGDMIVLHPKEPGEGS